MIDGRTVKPTFSTRSKHKHHILKHAAVMRRKIPKHLREKFKNDYGFAFSGFLSLCLRALFFVCIEVLIYGCVTTYAIKVLF